MKLLSDDVMLSQDTERKCNQLVTRNKQLVYQLTCQQHYLTEAAASFQRLVFGSCGHSHFDNVAIAILIL